MAAIVDQDALAERTDLIRLELGRRLNPTRRAAMGQFFTPSPIARFMANLSQVKGEAVRLLDAGAGIGSLSAAWIARVCSLGQKPSSIHLTAYEVDHRVAEYLRRTVDDCGTICRAAEVHLEAEVIEADFIRSAVELLADRPLWETARSGFDCAILNPPYRKLNSESETRRALRSVGIETSNLYTAFLWLVFRLLNEGGEMVAITPRSFCNGPYFRPFREAFLREMTLQRVHVFESRDSAFKDADVLQENLIFRAVRAKRADNAVVSSSANPEDPDICIREVQPDELVNRSDPDLVIHIVPDEIGTRFAKCVQRFPATLHDLGIDVSTGRVVDFRAKEALAFESNGKAVPLIYPAHIKNGYIAWPKQGKKPDYLLVTPNTESLLVPAGTYVLVKRFSAKEERRRVAAAICEPDRVPGDDYAFENHLNYFHRRGDGIPTRLAKGLAAYLNSTLVDGYFRQFSGHTQVNASDLRSLKYPDLATLNRLGGRIGEPFPNQADLDALIREELSMVEDDPVRVKQRIEEARQILALLGLPKAQQNERSALTLLALVDLAPNAAWRKASAPLRGITPIMDWFAEHYGKRYAPNTRETVRRQTVHQFMDAGIIVANPDEPSRPINSGKTVYQIEKGALELLRTYGTKAWEKNLRTWLTSVETLKARYARERSMRRIPLELATGQRIDLFPGGQNVLIKEVIEPVPGL